MPSTVFFFHRRSYGRILGSANWMPTYGTLNTEGAMQRLGNHESYWQRDERQEVSSDTNCETHRPAPG